MLAGVAIEAGEGDWTAREVAENPLSVVPLLYAHGDGGNDERWFPTDIDGGDDEDPGEPLAVPGPPFDARPLSDIGDEPRLKARGGCG